MNDEDKTINEDENKKEMSFFDHLDELRKRIIYSVLWIVVWTAISALFINYQMDYILLLPAKRAGMELQNLRPFGQAFLYFKVIFLSGIILSIPFILHELWKFIAPGLYENEQKWVRLLTMFTTVSFLLGVAFSYFVLVPTMLQFSASFGTTQIKNIIDVSEYFSFITMIILSAGLLFEMPIVSFILTRFGIINSKLLRKYWRHSMIVILLIAAVLTPTPDPINQLIFAAPLFILYEISIMVAKVAEKLKRKKAEKDNSEV